MQLDDLLQSHVDRLRDTRLAQLNHEDPARAHDFALQAGAVYLNFARQCWDREALAALFAYARSCNVAAGIRALFDGGEVNPTEARAALHTALRSDISTAAVAHEAHRTALATRDAMARVVDGIRHSDITDVVSFGIGGSDLGPRFVVDAFGNDGPQRVHFVSNADAHAIERALAPLDPARTAIIVISKSFSTQETLLNACIAKAWLGDAGSDRMFAVTSKQEAAHAFGIDASRVLPMWDWVGGRYSLWSAVGLPVAITLGMPAFEALLAGAAAMDAEVFNAPLEKNPAVWHALSVIWNTNGLGLAGHVVVPYDERLRLLPMYLQQLVMESLGKSVRIDGSQSGNTSPMWWGTAGTDAQHSYFQCLHQGTPAADIDLIGVINPDHAHAAQHQMVLANVLAQSEALANGQVSEDSHRVHTGNRPSTLMLLDQLTPGTLGQLIALYEHSVYVQSLLWGINAFDQFGVELGKRMAQGLLASWDETQVDRDPVTAALLGTIKRR